MNAPYLSVRHCPLCGAAADAFRPITDGGTNFTHERVVMCGACTLVLLTPRMSPAGLAAYYATDAFSVDFRGAPRPDSAATAYRDRRARRRWELLRDRLPAAGRCLEIGCSSGNFLQILRANGFETLGIDASTGYAQCARAGGLSVQIGEFPAALPATLEPCDVIAAFHVIEHVHQPATMLAEIRCRLKPHGVLAIEYPDVGRAAQRRKLLPSYFQKSHLHDFSLPTMTALLRSAGFGVVAQFVEHTEPYDKNVLLVATPAPIDRASAQVPAAEAERFYRTLTGKIAWSVRQQQRPPRAAISSSQWQRLKHAVRQPFRRGRKKSA